MTLRFRTRTLASLALLMFLPAADARAMDDRLHVIGLKGSLELKSMPMSAIVHRKITTWVYLPPGYNDPANVERRYPVVYLLHGQPGGWTDCFRSGKVEEMADRLIRDGEIQPVILVAFDGDGPRGGDDLTNFCNRADGYREEDFIVQELVPYVDATYRTRPDAAHRALWGYSGGGFGALNLGLHHPDVWGNLASHAGFYQPSDDAKAMNKVLGPPVANRGLWEQNSPLLTVRGLAAGSGLRIYMDASPDEEDYGSFQAMAAALQAKGVEVRAVTKKHAHAWKVVEGNSRDSLGFLDGGW